ncbi:hypothetical protein MIMGU_mgv1a016002mg [Erythranthe guttata]|uniref:Uncharacterized protein n=1 Tax=Erythranthe guttata TaxID=4155 RepID=A0A022R2L9_ERYGU|nr:hypothetical protein MIMGU_mgv1a016002mg [Erythranthe guttata]
MKRKKYPKYIGKREKYIFIYVERERERRERGERERPLYNILYKNIIDQGSLQVWRPRSLCFLEGAEKGTHLLGNKLEKWPRGLLLLLLCGVVLNAFIVVLEPLHCPTTICATITNANAVNTTNLLLLLLLFIFSLSWF